MNGRIISSKIWLNTNMFSKQLLFQVIIILISFKSFPASANRNSGRGSTQNNEKIAKLHLIIIDKEVGLKIKVCLLGVVALGGS